MAYEMVMPYHLHMPSYFLETFTEYPYVMLQIINRPWWWLLIMIFVPIANIIFSIIALKEFLEKFGKGIGFTIATIFFPFITFPMLAFGDDQFKNE